MKTRLLTLSLATIIASAQPALAQTAPKPAAKPAPVAALIKQVDIPYTQFTLANGLRVVVHTDRKAPVVAVSVWYNVGSKFEPKGKTGFAHLFEHLMFNGSENAQSDFYEPLKQVGGTDMNGSTYFDRTNYFETVPKTALDRTLFLESDRMGYLLGVVTQGRLDKQRGVVQNEKRQGDNRPYGLFQYKLLEGLFPADHPYGHTTIGSMADLDAASLDDVKSWFKDHYGPNNTVLVLAGDIDEATARPLVEKYFGAIPRGPQNVVPQVTIPTLAAPKSVVTKDRVAATMLVRAWTVPGLSDKDSTALDVAAGVLGGLASSRLDNALVRGEKLAVNVNASNSSFSQLGYFTISAVVKPGVDPATVATRLDALIADFLAHGPTKDEVDRYVTREVSGTIAGLEQVGGRGKAATLAEGALYSNDPGFYKKQLADLAATTPQSVQAAAKKWLSRPVFSLTIEPGAREAYAETVTPPKPEVKDPPFTGTRGAMPAAGALQDLVYPKVERTKLSNGVELVYAQRTAVPFTRAILSFDAGVAADVPGKLGTESLMLGMLDEGTETLNSIQIAETKERLGASIGMGMGSDRSTAYVAAPSANLAPAVDLLADMVRHPAFSPAEVERLRNAQLAGIAQELTDPGSLGRRVLPKLIYGPGSPYAKAAGAGDPAAVAKLTRDDLIAFHQAWFRPEKLKIFVVSDLPLADVKAALDRGFGDWKGTGAPGVKAFDQATKASSPRIVLIDRPDSPQSVIIGAVPTALSNSDDFLPLTTANDALGGGFLARINMNLRENKHWAYGASGSFVRDEHAAPYFVNAPVQADKTGPAIVELRKELSGYVGTAPMTQVEFDRAIAGGTRSLPGSFETSNALLSAMQANDLFKRPDDYYATITQKYRALTLPQLNAAIRAAVDPTKAVWVVVGDAKIVKPQLDGIGLPVTVLPAAAVGSLR
ncbi:M16 family metallopeptidase [Sphingomonas immobilis]|uniref:Pitrilysin family protein n=1 Tax=Sphingomonas immobilis TaxID=3063997 RepID=A0ABT8ZVJ8_9SPHN|nr:pitrilysin family protein [Sphingomonas sp. CA1-15]MDO7841584.1 pitrilysin family protein [Sphingomonas sp. CA1-15]